MYSEGASSLVSFFVGEFPVLLVELLALVVALAFLRRAPLPSVLTLAGVAILFVVTVGAAFVQMWLNESQRDGRLGVEEFVRLIRVVGLASNVVHALGLGLIVAAVFVGRRPAAEPPGR